MSRIVYLGFPDGRIAGGQKMILRHVETLQALGFQAVFWTNAAGRLPTWLSYDAPVEVGTAFRPDDILVLPEDAPNAIAAAAGMPQRALIFCQNHFTFASLSHDAVGRFPPASLPTFIACGRIAAASLARSFPGATVEVIPCFVDERVFRPRGAPHSRVAHVPRKRALEARVIRNLFARVHPAHADVPWLALEGLTEAAMAEALAHSTLFLSLSRLEAVGMTTLEAMACGCVPAGFTGIGGREFATPANGFWVEEDDCEGAADALARAADLVRTGGAPLRRFLEAGRETARLWSYAVFREGLEEVWTRLAPEARGDG